MRLTKTTSPALILAALLYPAVALAQAPESPQEGDQGAPPDGAAGGMVAPDDSRPPPPPQVVDPPTAEARPIRETVCDDRQDDDGDGLADCADADCFGNPICEAGGNTERNNDRCSDWIDNDGDGAVDCDDDECSGPGITVCQGSYTGPNEGGSTTGMGVDDIPELTGDMTVEDLIGNFGDADGERNDYLCSDGMDNDGDGRVDCADFGCRFDPQVTVCQGDPGFRFSVVTGISASYNFEENALAPGGSVPNTQDFGDVRFRRVQVRALGSIPMINNSFFLLNLRLENSPRLTFMVFQVPLGDTGHYVNVNSGSGGLSSGLIISTSKQPLLDPPFYLFNGFEQNNGAAAEFGGPLIGNTLRYRVFGAGGSGFFNGNVGGAFFRDDTRNFAWNAGGQLHLNILGSYDRFDTPYLYTPVPATLAILVGGKYDQRPRERFPAVNAQAVFEFSRFHARVESYSKYVLDYGGSFQTAWNAQLSVLAIPRWLMFAGDIGGFYPSEYGEGEPDFDSALRRPIQQFQWRVAAHWFWFRNIGLLSLMYRESRFEQNPDRAQDNTLEREMRLEAQFRF
ncbi:MAG: hypothetical protein JRH11_18940 [Deltaproteobacteria bacterium]|nr:hypothetical protein [Deltaproteobacteria bacterium]